MEYQDVKDWLDNLIRIKNEAKSLEKLNSGIEAIMTSMSDIHIYKGIEIIADVMGRKLYAKKWKNEKEVEYSFNYSGVKFFQLGLSNSEGKA